MKSFIPKDFQIPQGFTTDKFKLRMLTTDDLEKDFDAVSSSIDRLKGFFGVNSKWPVGITLEENLKDLDWHQKEFQERKSFAYTVMSPDEKVCLGCVYVFQSRNKNYEADVLMWVRESRKDLDHTLEQTVRKWIAKEWPFKSVAYPRR